ncbi:MAG: ATP-binding protein, partial [Gammaproteobacteria bacterium]|nr:ATP-binding protein [Gammaproteobacteria bacterium]
STVAGNLASKLGAIHIRSDIERKRLYDLVSTADSGSSVGQGIYTEGASQKTYSRLAELAQKLVENNFSVIVDATCLKSAQRGLFRQTAQRLDVPSFLISCQAPEKELRQRISQRLDQGGDASEANQRVLTNQLKNQEPLSKKELKDSGTILCHQPQLNSEQLKIISNRRALH